MGAMVYLTPEENKSLLFSKEEHRFTLHQMGTRVYSTPKKSKVLLYSEEEQNSNPLTRRASGVLYFLGENSKGARINSTPKNKDLLCSQGWHAVYFTSKGAKIYIVKESTGLLYSQGRGTGYTLLIRAARCLLYSKREQ